MARRKTMVLMAAAVLGVLVGCTPGDQIGAQALPAAPACSADPTAMSSWSPATSRSGLLPDSESPTAARVCEYVVNGDEVEVTMERELTAAELLRLGRLGDIAPDKAGPVCSVLPGDQSVRAVQIAYGDEVVTLTLGPCAEVRSSLGTGVTNLAVAEILGPLFTA